MKKIVIIILMISLISMGCSNKKALEDNINEKIWRNNTINLIKNSSGKDGGYSLLINERVPSFSDTKYALKLLKNNNQTISNQDKLGETLNHALENTISLKGINYLLDTSSIIDIFKELNLSLNNETRDKLISNIMSFYYEDGFFRLNKNDDLLKILTVTELCINILSGLNSNLDTAKLNDNIESIYDKKLIEKLDTHYKLTIYNTLNHIQVLTKGTNYYDTEKGKELLSEFKNKASEIFSKIPEEKIELINDLALYELLDSNNLTPIVSLTYLNYLESIRLSDGGFNILGTETSDLKSSYRILKLFPDNQLSKIKKLINEIQKYQLANGIFVSRNEIKSDMIDSYMALKIMKDIDISIPNSLKIYLKNSFENKTLSNKEKYLYYEALNELYPDQYQQEELLSVDKINSMPIKDQLYIVLNGKVNVLSENEKKKICEQLLKYKLHSGGYGFKNTEDLSDTYLIVNVLVKLGMLDKVDKETYNWLINTQKRDGGFSVLNNDSTIEETYYALATINLLRIKPKDTISIKKFINSLKTQSGGFKYSKQDNTISLASLYYGLESERFLIETTKD